MAARATSTRDGRVCEPAWNQSRAERVLRGGWRTPTPALVNIKPRERAQRRAAGHDDGHHRQRRAARTRCARALVSAGLSRVDSPKRGNPPRRPPPAGRRWGIHLAGLWASGLLGVSGSVQHGPRRQASAADDRLSHTPAWHAEGPAHRCQPIQPWPWQRLGQGCGRAARLLLSPSVRLPARASARLPALLLVCSTIHVPAFQIKHNIRTC
jgi:hypothetical protein